MLPLRERRIGDWKHIQTQMAEKFQRKRHNTPFKVFFLNPSKRTLLQSQRRTPAAKGGQEAVGGEERGGVLQLDRIEEVCLFRKGGVCKKRKGGGE